MTWSRTVCLLALSPNHTRFSGASFTRDLLRRRCFGRGPGDRPRAAEEESLLLRVSAQLYNSIEQYERLAEALRNYQ